MFRLKSVGYAKTHYGTPRARVSYLSDNSYYGKTSLKQIGARNK